MHMATYMAEKKSWYLVFVHNSHSKVLGLNMWGKSVYNTQIITITYIQSYYPDYDDACSWIKN